MHTLIWPIAAFFAITMLLIIWLPSIRDSLIDFAIKDKMPIWLTLSLAAGAAAGTYIIAPLLNQDFEFQKNRSAHLLQTVNELNTLSVRLAIDVRRFDDSLFYQKSTLDDRRGELLDKITELQWSLIDVDVIIKRAKKSDTSVKNLSSSLDELHKTIIQAKYPLDQERVITSSKSVASAARSCVSALYSAANLDSN